MGAKKQSGNIDYAFLGMSMSDIRHSIVDNFLGGIARERKPRPIMVWGAPGEGKTLTTIAAARELKRRLAAEEFQFFDIPTSCLEPCDVVGIPFPVEIGGVATYSKYLAPNWAYLISKEYEVAEQEKDPDFKAPPALILFDDVTAAHFQTQSAFYKGVHEGKWGELNQRDNVMVVACGNRDTDNAAANDMPTALANRFEHNYANPTTDDWLKWATSFREEGEPGVKGEFRIFPLVVAFIRHCKSDLREFNSEVAVRSEKAFASCRTWEAVSELHYEGQVVQGSAEDGPGPYFAKKVMGIVGKGVATKYLGFLRDSTSLVPPDVIVKNPKTCPVPSARCLDALHATVASLEMHLKQNPQDWKAGMIYSMRKEMLSDVSVLLVQTISEVIQDLPNKQRNKAMGDDVFMKFLEENEELIDLIT